MPVKSNKFPAPVVTKKILVADDRVKKASRTSLEEAISQVQLLKSRWLIAKAQNSNLLEEYIRNFELDKSKLKDSSTTIESKRKYQAALLQSRDVRASYKEALAFLVFLKKKLANPELRKENQRKSRIKRAKRRQNLRFNARVSTTRPHTR